MHHFTSKKLVVLKFSISLNSIIILDLIIITLVIIILICNNCNFLQFSEMFCSTCSCCLLINTFLDVNYNLPALLLMVHVIVHFFLKFL